MLLLFFSVALLRQGSFCIACHNYPYCPFVDSVRLLSCKSFGIVVQNQGNLEKKIQIALTVGYGKKRSKVQLW